MPVQQCCSYHMRCSSESQLHKAHSACKIISELAFTSRLALFFDPLFSKLNFTYCYCLKLQLLKKLLVVVNKIDNVVTHVLINAPSAKRVTFSVVMIAMLI